MDRNQRFDLLALIQPRLLRMGSMHESTWIVDFVAERERDYEKAKLRCLEVVERRERHEPLAYIFGTWAFRSYEFSVGPGVLIPRPETEELVEAALMSLENSWSTSQIALDRELVIADLGAGSGCIGLALICDLLKDVETETAKSREVSQKYKVILVEKSPEALRHLKQNVERLRPQLKETQVEIVEASWKDWKAEACHLLLSNPPYLTESEFHLVDASVKDFEPKSALVPSDIAQEAQAFGPYKDILEIARHALVSGGWLWFELGQTQPGWVQDFAKQFPEFNDLRMMRDMAGKYRFFCARRN